MEHDLYNTIGNIDVCTECRLLKSQSRYSFSRHDGFLDTQDGHYQSPHFIDAHHQVFVDPPLTHRSGRNFSGLNRCLLSKEKNHSSTTSDLLSPNYTTVARKTSFTLPRLKKYCATLSRDSHVRLTISGQVHSEPTLLRQSSLALSPRPV